MNDDEVNSKSRLKRLEVQRPVDTHKVVHLPTGKTVLTGTQGQCLSAADDWARATHKRIHEVQPIEQA